MKDIKVNFENNYKLKDQTTEKGIKVLMLKGEKGDLANAEWGNITGTLSDQTDLQSALNNKANTSDIPTKTSDLTNDNGFIDNSVNNLINYTLATETGHSIDLQMNSTTYELTLSLKNSEGTVLNSKSVDLPLETMVVGGSYDSINKKIVLTLKNGNTIDVSVANLISGLQNEITSSNKLDSDLVDDTNQVNKFVSASEKQTWNNKQDTLVSGTNIKTINNNSILGSGNLSIQEVYSTNEQVIGTWIDGKPLYRKVTPVTTSTTFNYNTWVELNTINVNSVSQIIECKYFANLGYTMPLIAYRSNSGVLNVMNLRNTTIESSNFEILLEYTKTTD